jgi:hypothetical protein
MFLINSYKYGMNFSPLRAGLFYSKLCKIIRILPIACSHFNSISRMRIGRFLHVESSLYFGLLFPNFFEERCVECS